MVEDAEKPTFQQGSVSQTFQSSKTPLCVRVLRRVLKTVFECDRATSAASGHGNIAVLPRSDASRQLVPTRKAQLESLASIVIIILKHEMEKDRMRKSAD